MISLKFSGSGLNPLNTDWWPKTQKQWAPVLLEDQRPFWKSQHDPNTGRPWKSLSPNYAKWKSQNYGPLPILRLTGTMQDTAKIVPEKTGFKVLTTRYGAYNQFGTAKMPARPWMGVPDTSIQKLMAIAFKNIFSTK